MVDKVFLLKGEKKSDLEIEINEGKNEIRNCKNGIWPTNTCACIVIPVFL